MQKLCIGGRAIPQRLYECLCRRNDCAQACIKLDRGKVRLRKLLLRIRQCARNADNPEAYTTALNTHNLAALFKLREASRLRPPGSVKSAERDAAQATRDAMVQVWHESRLEAHRTFEPDEERASEYRRPPAPPEWCASGLSCHHQCCSYADINALP
jgi:hypothetical protein